MPRQGREFELLIERIEKMALSSDAKILSPGYLEDKITGESREIDILIEDKVGTSPIRIIIECRDRNSVEDVIWVEQVHAKLKDVQANKAILVSSNKFTEPAIRKATFYEIDCRTYNEIDLKVIHSWWHPAHITYMNKQIKIISVVLQTSEACKTDVLNGKTTGVKFIKSKNDGKLYSLNDVAMAAVGQMKNIDDAILVEPQYYRIDVERNTNDIILLTDGDLDREIVGIIFKLEVRFIRTEISVSRVTQYGSTNRIITQTIEFDNFPIDGNPTLQFIKNEDGSIKILVRPSV
jgi:hypothetical protein